MKLDPQRLIKKIMKNKNKEKFLSDLWERWKDGVSQSEKYKNQYLSPFRRP
jgi:hypothetical protein